MMGSTQAEIDALVKEFGKDSERYVKCEMPQHKVVIEKPFAVGLSAVTVAEYMAGVKDGARASLRNGWRIGAATISRPAQTAITRNWATR
jgi:hypothetical protein